MARVVWSQEARLQLKEIVEWIARDAPGVAAKWARKLSRSTDVLKSLPEIGSPVEEFPGDNLRELIVVTKDGRRHPIELEPGAPYVGFWNVMKTVAQVMATDT